jgi:hypothetical protein
MAKDLNVDELLDYLDEITVDAPSSNVKHIPRPPAKGRSEDNVSKK